MMKHWSFFLIVGGLGLDVLDTFTTRKGSDGGVIYGTGGLLAGLNNKLPGAINIGELLAIVGVASMIFKHKG